MIYIYEFKMENHQKPNIYFPVNLLQIKLKIIKLYLHHQTQMLYKHKAI